MEDTTMIKKEYIKPILEVEKTEIISQLMVGSLRSVKSSGLDNEDDLQYDGSGGDQGYAW
jgi:hypothetical protein